MSSRATRLLPSIPGPEVLGSVAWLEATNGRLTWGERGILLLGSFGMFAQGVRLSRRAKSRSLRNVSLSDLEPPDTPMVRGARSLIDEIASPQMRGHVYRTGYWTQLVLRQNGEPTPTELETAWVAALLHDVGTEHPTPRGDFATAGSQAMKRLANEHRWSEDQTQAAAEGIAGNFATLVDRDRLGLVTWAIHAGGAGELGLPFYRGQWLDPHIADLERRYPRDGFKRHVLHLMKGEARRVPGGRFALMRHFFPLLLKS
jgi:hypothetical protein